MPNSQAKEACLGSFVQLVCCKVKVKIRLQDALCSSASLPFDPPGSKINVFFFFA